MRKFIALFVLAVGLGGCFLPKEITKYTILREESLADEEGAFSEDGEEEGFEAIPGTETLDPEQKAQLLREQQSRYAFSTLELTQQNLYAEIYHALTGYTEEMELSSLDTEEIDLVFQCVLLDHPEIFYADGYSFTQYSLGEEIKKITFTGSYVYSREEKEAREKLIEEAAKEVISGLEAKATDYEKVRYVYEWVIHNTEYDMEAEDNQNICSVLLNGRSVCQGYAKTVQYLLEKLGIPTALVIGQVGNAEGHAWNMAKINNEYYYIDSTWGDASYLVHNEDGSRGEHIPEINYDYLCVTTKELAKTHIFSDLVPLPDCTSMEANYYVQEGAYFTQEDWPKLEALIERYRGEARETLTLKCSGAELYQRMRAELLEEQRIFDYLQPSGDSIMYTSSDEQLSLTFWL